MKTNEDTEVYLGDGLYASFDGYAITLRAPRMFDNHYVILEPEVQKKYIEFAKKVMPDETKC